MVQERRFSSRQSMYHTLALFTVSTYSIESNTDTKQVQTIDLKNEDNPITLFSEDKSIEEPQWLIGTQAL